MRVSVVMAYHNRRLLLVNTLTTIAKSALKNKVEVIIVDDASDEENRICDLTGTYGLDIKVIQIEQEDKWWHNSCIPFNRGFNKATGDIIIIQDPECIHVGDIISYAVENISKNKYIAFSCYSADKDKTDRLLQDDISIENVRTILTPFKNAHPSNDCENGWYCHSKYNPCAHHFCSAISKEDLDELGGFDERYADGFAYEDVEFISRVRRKQMHVEIIDNPFVVHQAHKPSDYNGKQELFLRNQNLYYGRT